MSAARAARRAEALITEFEVAGPEIDVRSLAENLGLTIVEDDLGDDISGALVTNQSGVVILVQLSHSENRKRFTIAHELAHHVLRHQFEEGGHVHVDRGNYISLRGRRASEGVDPKEIEANWFAAALLMPSRMVKAEVSQLGVKALHDHHVEQLAGKFVVSQQAMTIRLSNLGLL
jgi:Zn-dependent peptidase ImmA (M78 family)